MNNKLEAYKKDIQGKKVAVLGIGISNTPLIKYLAALGVDITAFDMSEEKQLAASLKELEGLKVAYSLGRDYLKSLKGFDIIFKTPKVRFDIPELVAEKSRGAEITSEMEVFCNLCPARIFAVTGSDGKTTTTTLIHLMLKEQGYNCWLGGNIGTPLLDRIDDISESDMVVLELSSFQLHTMNNRLQTAVVTNLSPNHLDVHLSMEEYAAAKKNIFLHQKQEDLLILNAANDITRGFASEAKGRIAWFGREGAGGYNAINGLMASEGSKSADGVYTINRDIVSIDEGKLQKIMEVDDILLPGVHNVENYLAAIAAVKGFVDHENMRKVAMTFRGVEHRIEFVAEVNGVSFYNDSIGSSPTRTEASINSFKKPVILIAGGYDKHIPYDEMGKVLSEKVKCLVLIGQTGPLIEKALREETVRTGKGAEVPSVYCQTLQEAVETAYSKAVKDDIILLSPASASFDMFRNFEERGEKFKAAVIGL
ncbi:MAG: UDP-N-acetylmuramoyl-L-alanine--D-glutamate ligase [Clostridiales bacterium]|nr:UDP-N-acetylmuramoyl-L-alanine--D-glutamate ligase [Clostridiales bacterium]